MPDATEYKPLYNGNISSMVLGIPKLGETQLYNYGYDQLNRLISMDRWKGYDAQTGSWEVLQKTEDFKERISYDANGNILSYLRNGSSTPPAGGAGGGLLMDDMQYGYNKDANGNIVNNKLRHVKDAVANANYTEDIDNQNDDNYGYDAIGNLIRDNAEKITNIEWSVYGKILRITKTATANGDVSAISYTYDAAGNRISKRVEALNKQDKYTWYARDASGNTMAVYEYEGTNTNNNILYLKEQHLYGSSRLGVWNRNVNMDEKLATTNIPLLGPTQIGSFERGNKFFELNSHLSNVLVTVSDKKIGVDSDNDGDIDYYIADVLTANDYAPFGMQLVGRKWNGDNYRYGFNGKEKDNEVKGQGNSIDFGDRMYDSRLGRWLSLDPYAGSYSDMSPYSAMGNNPMFFIDPTGGFLMDVHKRIVKKAFAQSKRQNITKDVTAYRSAISGTSSINSGSIVAPDVRTLPVYLGGGGKKSIETEHFDGMNFNQIVNNYNSVIKNINAAVNQYKNGKISSDGLGKKTGEYFHAIQDLYSHSNYVELYEQKFGQTDVNLIPTIQEAMTQEKYKDFASLLKKELKTGVYPGKDKGSHKDLNHDLGKGSRYGFLPEVKDKSVDWNSKAAEAVATKATTVLNDKIENQIK